VTAILRSIEAIIKTYRKREK
jgi:hypothetical protein